MSRYIVGDIHGCYTTLQSLLCTVGFNPSRDELWAVGDLIGRGPDPLRTLTYLANLDNAFQCTLGNHDLHFLAVYSGCQPIRASHCTRELLSAPNISQLVGWLRHQPLTLSDNCNNLFVSHAGIPPAWNVHQASEYASEVESILLGSDWKQLLMHMYGDQPDKWCSSLLGYDRYRFIINALTRMRYCTTDGRLDLSWKEPPHLEVPANLKPWYSFVPESETTLFFGHWAALCGKTERNDIIGLDTGCIWGGPLTLYDCDRQEKVSVPSLES
ncbi:symmetrical bis(5'-nucleosyl)-tetraphosphatase [Aliidiomarina quisquiliarum]|uniref:symmetrical bis(5'-nucleosyl)-tetraphosphatase n=1 Tax=Aliidiomarina quisquiliarum TaxID=2938947 RepID=UPI00208F7F32|nr:symmetrical bis(5'-nucleosyl)-tetraphosphatase [Aliidiomarina quisquiliarum]MCO4322626.1 symmetrical bis(5'-nucleosyl)-tetraphosphatase [Aliidiomarina quisquiliarum]